MQPFWKRPRGKLWTLAGALFAAGLLISIFTPFKIVLLFLPLTLVPGLFSRRDEEDDDPPR